MGRRNEIDEREEQRHAGEGEERHELTYIRNECGPSKVSEGPSWLEGGSARGI